MPRTTTVHLLQGDYPDRLERLAAAAAGALEDNSPRTAIEEHPYSAIEAEYKALKAEAIENGKTVHMAALGRGAWRQLKAKYPPRSVEESDEETARGDKLSGVNTDAAEDDLVYESVKAWQDETGEKVSYGSSRGAFDEWADSLSEGEWQVIVIRAWELANGFRLDPKDLPSLPMTSDD